MIKPVKEFNNHTMGISLKPYIEMKMHHFIDSEDFNCVSIIPKYNRNSEHSNREKTDKLFNWQRPTATLINGKLTIECFPGKDYVNNYYSLISTYLIHSNRSHIKIEVTEPTANEINMAILETNIADLKYPETVILGTVEQLQSITNTEWIGDGPFKMSRSKNIAFVGCEFSFWGDISKYVAKNIVINGARQILYVGKLGTLNAAIEPNVSLASGNKSTIQNKVFKWESILSIEENEYENLYLGNHITLPSVMQETNLWLNENIDFDFVDPEIGQMARGTLEEQGSFGYLHIISDNLAKKYDEDLSNERKAEVQTKRAKSTELIIEILNSKLKKST